MKKRKKSQKSSSNKKGSKKTKGGTWSKSCIAALVFGILSLLFGFFPLFGWGFISLTWIFSGLGLKYVKEDKKLRGKNIAIAALVMSMIGLLFAILFMVKIMDDNNSYCEDAQCFVERANNCQYATLQLFEEEGQYHYETHSCVLTKTLLSLSDQEPEDLRGVLKGSSLTCKYSNNNFNRDWIESPIVGIEDCEGELKELLMQLIVFV